MLTCAIDEAGRGPLIGPLVMAGVLVDEDGIAALRKLGVKDSKLLSQDKRVAMYPKILDAVQAHNVVVVSPVEIDAALSSADMNLNWLEAHTSAKIINALGPGRIVVDCPSVNISAYRAYLLNLLDSTVDAVVEHKADVTYAECSAASIIAKVVREQEIETIKKSVGDFGSGYLTDPKTTAFLQAYGGKHPDVFRRSWAPYKAWHALREQKTITEY